MSHVPSVVRVVVAEDQPMVRAGFVALLDHARGISVVGEAANGSEAINVSLATRPDVLLMDVAMPVVDGIDATRHLLAAHQALDAPAPRILVLSRDDGDALTYEALRAGASGFVPKDARPDVLARAVRTVAADEALHDPQSTVRLVEEFTTVGDEDDPEVVTLTEAFAALDDADARLIVAVARGYSDAEVAAHFGVADDTVSDRVRHLSEAVGAAGRVQLVVAAHEVDLVGAIVVAGARAAAADQASPDSTS